MRHGRRRCPLRPGEPPGGAARASAAPGPGAGPRESGPRCGPAGWEPGRWTGQAPGRAHTAALPRSRPGPRGTAAGPPEPGSAAAREPLPAPEWSAAGPWLSPPLPKLSGEEPAEPRRTAGERRRQARVPGQPGLRTVVMGAAVEDAVRAEIVTVDPVYRMEQVVRPVRIGGLRGLL